MYIRPAGLVDLVDFDNSKKYPKNLLDVIAEANGKAQWEWERNFPPVDLLETIDYIMSVSLSQREYNLLRWRFIDGYTLDEIAKKITNSSKERVRQNYHSAIKRLCNPECLLFLKKGINELTTNYIERKLNDDDFSITIDELGLSVRCYNCLSRAKIIHIGDLEEMTFREFRQIRNFGVATQNEFLTKIAEHGFSFQEETDPDEHIVLQIASVSNG